MCLLFALIIYRLVNLQIINGEKYLITAESRVFDVLPLRAARGNILDRYGRPIVTNKISLSLVIQKRNLTKSHINQLIVNLIEMLESSNHAIICDGLPITKTFRYEFTENVKNNINLNKFTKNLIKEKKLSENYGAEELINALILKYEIDVSKYRPEILRKILDINYDMDLRAFSSGNPYVIAHDVDVEVAVKINEQKDTFKGVVIIEEPSRCYINQELASHILGRVGPIYREEYEKLKYKNYSIHSIIGKDGLEKALEDDIKGKDGIFLVGSRKSSILSSLTPTPGNNAMLTLDIKLQEALENSLRDRIQSISSASAGAGIVVNVNTGEILAIASYPTFKLSEFDKNYNQMIKDPNKPLFNRATYGLYAPGSTLKSLVAIAALQEGIITPKDQIKDLGIYTYYPGYHPTCLVYKKCGYTHGLVNVEKALQTSCNYFFYEIGRRLGIENIAKYCKYFGLGAKTGIEIENESVGIIASPEFKAKSGQLWYPGNTLQAAIGQSDNAFTLTQLATYISMISNGGVRHKLYLIKSIHSSSDGKLLKLFTPEIIQKIEISPENKEAIFNGMALASKSGTASNAFGNFKMQICSKTGTAEISDGIVDNGLFVAFGPKERPEIAVVVVVEHAKWGSAITQIARDVFDAYFKTGYRQDISHKNNVLLA